MSTGSDDINNVLNRIAEKILDQTDNRSESRSDGGTSSGLSFEEFVEAATSSVLRAVEARSQRAGDERANFNLLSLPPITVGIILHPDIRQPRLPEVRGLPGTGERMIPTGLIVWLLSKEGQKWLEEEKKKADAAQSTAGDRSAGDGAAEDYHQ